MKTSEALHARLGLFVITFQQVEASMVDLIVRIVDEDPEYVQALTAELEFTAKARAMDVIYTRFAQIHGLTTESPEPTVHKLATRIQKTAVRRNELVHSFYVHLIKVDASIALARMPTRLKPSEGRRMQDEEIIGPELLGKEIAEMLEIDRELRGLCLSVLQAKQPTPEA
jgi:hypothetical protein